MQNISGNVTILVNTGGSRNPCTNPPINEIEAIDAINTMNSYYFNGYRGAWHTEAACKIHEEWHYTEWKCASELYWPSIEVCIEQFTVPISLYANEADARAALIALGADAKINEFFNAAINYWGTLSDSGNDNPYATGQSVLNTATIYVQNLAATNGWTVPSGLTSASTTAPCYQPSTTLTLSCP